MEMEEKSVTFDQTFEIEGKVIESTFTFCKTESQTFRDLYEKYKEKITLMYKRCFGDIAGKFLNTVSVLHYKKDGDDTEFFGIADLTPDHPHTKYTLWSVCIDVSLLNATPSLGQQLLRAIIDWSDFDLDLYVDLKNPFFHKAFKLYLKNRFTPKDIVIFPGNSKKYIHMYRENINPKSVMSISDSEYIKLLLKYKDYPEICDLVQQYVHKAQISLYSNDGERSLYTHYYRPFYSPTSTICITQKEYEEITKIFTFVKGDFNTDVKSEFTQKFNLFFFIRDDHIFLIYEPLTHNHIILDTYYVKYDFLENEISTYKFNEIYDELYKADANPILNLQQKETELFSHLGFCMVWAPFFYDCLINKVDIDTVYKTLLLSSPYSLTKFILIYFDMISNKSETSLVKRVMDSIKPLAPQSSHIVCNDFLNLHIEYDLYLIQSKIMHNKDVLGDQNVVVFPSKFKHKTKIIKKSLKKRSVGCKKSLKKRSVGCKKSPKKLLKKSHLKRTFVKKSKKVKRSVSRRK
jgi:hypothetical protein